MSSVEAAGNARLIYESDLPLLSLGPGLEQRRGWRQSPTRASKRRDGWPIHKRCLKQASPKLRLEQAPPNQDPETGADPWFCEVISIAQPHLP